MKKNLIALALVIVMVFALAACGEEEAPVVTEAPQQSAVAEQPAQSGEAVVDPSLVESEEATGVEPNSGVHTYVSDVNNISFDYDSKYVAMSNQAGNAMVYAGQTTEIPFCMVSLMEFEEATEYLKEMAAAAELEQGKELKTKPGEPTKLDLGERDIYYIYYTYEDKDVGGVVCCAYYAENIGNSQIVIYNSTGIEGQTADVDAILSLAIQTFKMAE